MKAAEGANLLSMLGRIDTKVTELSQMNTKFKR